ncbi:MAG TPA: NfeD family protein [Pirellulaceae bacterium]|nr:NfeD family protein [Pirellulaceae bacterium]
MTPVTWAILLLVLGLVFLVLEFFIPSGGALAVMCALSFLAAIIVGFMAGPWTGATILLVVCLVVPSATAAAVRWWPDTPIGKLMLIQRPRSSDDVLPETVAYRGLKDLIGRRGRAKGLMVPSGSVLIDGKTYDAVSEGMTIEPHQSVIVVSVSTQRLVVRADHTIEAQLAESQPAASPIASNAPLIDDIPDPFAE